MYKVFSKISILLAFLVLVPIFVVVSGNYASAAYAENIVISDINTLANQERTNKGLPALKMNRSLSDAAFAKASHMIANNYWAHFAPDGTSPWSFIISAGYDYSSAGENLANGFNTSAGVVSGWMNSPTHRANVLGSEYADVGYAVINGLLKGSETTLVVAMYGKTAPVTVAQSSAANIDTSEKVSNSSSVLGTQVTSDKELKTDNTLIGVIDVIAILAVVLSFSSLEKKRKLA